MGTVDYHQPLLGNQHQHAHLSIGMLRNEKLSLDRRIRSTEAKAVEVAVSCGLLKQVVQHIQTVVKNVQDLKHMQNDLSEQSLLFDQKFNLFCDQITTTDIIGARNTLCDAGSKRAKRQPIRAVPQDTETPSLVVEFCNGNEPPRHRHIEEEARSIEANISSNSSSSIKLEDIDCLGGDSASTHPLSDLLAQPGSSVEYVVDSSINDTSMANSLVEHFQVDSPFGDYLDEDNDDDTLYSDVSKQRSDTSQDIHSGKDLSQMAIALYPAEVHINNNKFSTDYHSSTASYSNALPTTSKGKRYSESNTDSDLSIEKTQYKSATKTFEDFPALEKTVQVSVALPVLRSFLTSEQLNLLVNRFGEGFLPLPGGYIIANKLLRLFSKTEDLLAIGRDSLPCNELLDQIRSTVFTLHPVTSQAEQQRIWRLCVVRMKRVVQNLKAHHLRARNGKKNETMSE